ncbi:MAG: isoleucine--tRNA ligase [bacterium]|nr:isoleucine--tRNA ligase [bacterium]
MAFKKVEVKQSFPKMEEEILKFWEENKIFQKSLENRVDCPLYTFYDGPPFATGTPHYGHLVGSAMKDIVPRFWTMKGRYVPRKWGWDCHGLPIENIVEKELGSKAKKDIEEMGVDKFNDLCRSKVLTYVSEWEKTVKRFGRWADMKNAYKTMDLSYMESVWWVFKELYDKGLIYEGYRSMHICPRCETTLSQSEVAEGYKDVKDLSVIASFELIDEPNTFVLAWTTTPWTLIGNVALAVGENIKYVLVKYENNFYILAKERIQDVFKNKEYEITNEIDGKNLIGKSYKPLFDYYSSQEKLENQENGWKIYAGDFVTTEDGTGIVHIAPAFGEDDMNLGKKEKLPFVQHVGMDGIIKSEAIDFAGLHVKPEGDLQKTDVEIIKYLAKNNLLFSKEKYEHSYPHCWRCETPLINYATSSWFVSVEKIKEKMLETAKEINWSPAHIKNGRFGNWLESARDWSISRQRFWASVMPIWKCECGELKVFGSVKELEDLSGEKITDIHKHIVDKINFKCEKCGEEMKRIPDVLDTWFDSGSMPYAQIHYPFENKDKFEKGFPAEFIAEGIDQTRCWFYYLHVISNGIKDSLAFKNVVVNGIVLAEDGKKMAKRLQNYPDPNYVLEKYGADALRFYLTSSSVMQAENLNFKEADLSDLVRGMFRMLWNSYSFFVLYANIDGFVPTGRDAINRVSTGGNLLDRWIISELNMLMQDVNENMERYELTRAARCFPKFIDNLSNWYIRRSRKRFWKSENDGDKNEAYATLHYVLVTLSKLMAPFTPFIAEEIYRNLSGAVETQNFASVHLEYFPIADEKLIDEKLNKEMAKARYIVSKGLQLRALAGIKVRQPLNEIRFGEDITEELKEIIIEELNVKMFVYKKELNSLGNDGDIELDTNITKELKLEGQAREVIRFVQEMRKTAGYEVDNRIEIFYSGESIVLEKFNILIAKETLANGIMSSDDLSGADLKKTFEIDGEKLEVGIRKA